MCGFLFSVSFSLTWATRRCCRHRGMINFLPLFYVTHWKIRKQSPVLSFGIGSDGFFSLPVDARSQFFHTRLVSKAILGRLSRFIFVQLNLFVFFPFHIHHLNEMRRCQFQTHTHLALLIVRHSHHIAIEPRYIPTMCPLENMLGYISACFPFFFSLSGNLIVEPSHFTSTRNLIHLDVCICVRDATSLSPSLF